jgi:hypothetical protein
MALFNLNEKKILELQDTIGELEEKNSGLLKECQGYKQTIASFMDVKASYDDEKSKLVKKYEISLNQLKEQIEMEKKSVAKKVNMELSAIGIKTFIPEEISEEVTVSSPEQILKQFTSMEESPEKHAFFKKYEKVISQFVKKPN